MADGAQAGARPAYYAASPGRWRDWWTLLHPPYTAWHLAYVVIGATLAPHVLLVPLLATLTFNDEAPQYLVAALLRPGTAALRRQSLARWQNQDALNRE